MAFLLAITAVPLLLIAVGSLAVLTSVGFNNARGMDYVKDVRAKIPRD